MFSRILTFKSIFSDAGEIRLDGTVLCPGLSDRKYCNCSYDCTANPSWCSCVNAASCCASASGTCNIRNCNEHILELYF